MDDQVHRSRPCRPASSIGRIDPGRPRRGRVVGARLPPQLDGGYSRYDRIRSRALFGPFWWLRRSPVSLGWDPHAGNTCAGDTSARRAGGAPGLSRARERRLSARVPAPDRCLRKRRRMPEALVLACEGIGLGSHGHRSHRTRSAQGIRRVVAHHALAALPRQLLRACDHAPGLPSHSTCRQDDGAGGPR